MGDRARAVGRKVGAAVSLSVGGLGPDITQYGLGRGLPPYQLASKLKSELFYLSYTVISLLFIVSSHRSKAPLIRSRRTGLYNL